jgi:hypothetical protein
MKCQFINYNKKKLFQTLKLEKVKIKSIEILKINRFVSQTEEYVIARVGAKNSETSK